MEVFAVSRAAEALNLGSHEHVSLVGGGGKTTLWHAISAGLSGSVVLTTTTKMGADQHRGLPWLLAPSDQQVRDALAEHQRVIAELIKPILAGRSALQYEVDPADA